VGIFPELGVTAKVTPLQAVKLILLTVAAGYTVTVTVKVAPVQESVAGVTIYTTSTGALVVLLNVAKKVAAPLAPVNPEIPDMAVGADHE
jgi:hypothetical protein